MGLFGKKKEADVAPAAEASAPAEGGETKLCAICKQEKPVEGGAMMLEGTAFRCKDCADKDEGEEHGEVCEFC